MTQLALSYTHTPSYSEDDFVITQSNQSMFEQLDNWQTWPNKALMLVAPQGAGKTHLAHVFQNRTNAKLIDISQDTPPDISTLTHRTPLILENIHAPNWQEDDVFKVLNHALSSSIALFITSDRKADHLSHVYSRQDITSRLKLINTVVLELPDDFLISAIYTKCLADRQVMFNANILSTFVRYGPRDYEGIQRVINAIDKKVAEDKAKLTREQAKKIAQDLQREALPQLPY